MVFHDNQGVCLLIMSMGETEKYSGRLHIQGDPHGRGILLVDRSVEVAF